MARKFIVLNIEDGVDNVPQREFDRKSQVVEYFESAYGACDDVVGNFVVCQEGSKKPFLISRSGAKYFVGQSLVGTKKRTKRQAQLQKYNVWVHSSAVDGYLVVYADCVSEARLKTARALLKAYPGRLWIIDLIQETMGA